MTSDPIRAAIEQLRADLDRLPEHLREPWEYRITSLYMNGTSHGSVVAVPHLGPSPVSACTGAVGEHIASLHNVTEELIALLAEIDKPPAETNEEVERGLLPLAWISRVSNAGRALATAITRRPE